MDRRTSGGGVPRSDSGLEPGEGSSSRAKSDDDQLSFVENVGFSLEPVIPASERVSRGPGNGDPNDEMAEEQVEDIRELQEDLSAAESRRHDEDDDDDDRSMSRHHHPNVFVDSDDQGQRGSIKHSVVIVCDCAKLSTPVGLLKIIISISCIVSLVCICCTDYPSLPLSAYARLQIFVLTFTFLSVLLLFFIEILTLSILFPVQWDFWNAILHFAMCLLLNTSSSLVIHALFTNELSMPHLDTTMELIIISGVSGYFCALLCLLTSAIACCCYEHHMTLPWKEHPEAVMMLR